MTTDTLSTLTRRGKRANLYAYMEETQRERAWTVDNLRGLQGVYPPDDVRVDALQEMIDALETRGHDALMFSHGQYRTGYMTASHGFFAECGHLPKGRIIAETQTK